MQPLAPLLGSGFIFKFLWIKFHYLDIIPLQSQIAATLTRSSLIRYFAFTASTQTPNGDCSRTHDRHYRQRVTYSISICGSVFSLRLEKPEICSKNSQISLRMSGYIPSIKCHLRF